MDVNEHISDSIDQTAKEKKLSSRKIARCLGVSTPTVIKWRNGNYDFRIEQIKAIEKYFCTQIIDIKASKDKDKDKNLTTYTSVADI